MRLVDSVRRVLTVAAGLLMVATTVSYSVEEPVTFFVGGVRYRIPTATMLKPTCSAASASDSKFENSKFQILNSFSPPRKDSFATSPAAGRGLRASAQERRASRGAGAPSS
jgi:hypothetical protein